MKKRSIAILLGIFIVLLLATIGITFCDLPKSAYEIISKKQHLSNEVRNKVARQLKQELGLQPCGTSGRMMHEIQILGLSFFYYQPVDITEARKLLVKSVQAMLKEVNEKPEIHPYLIRYPFAPRNVEIQIFLHNPDGTEINTGALLVLSASEGILSYTIENPETKRLVTVYEETYEEALERLADPSLPLVPFKPEPEKTKEELNRLHGSISLVDKDGRIWRLDEKGQWIQNPQTK